MSQFNIISAAAESTVVAEYTPDACRSDSYQSEAALEQEEGIEKVIYLCLEE